MTERILSLEWRNLARRIARISRKHGVKFATIDAMVLELAFMAQLERQRGYANACPSSIAAHDAAVAYVRKRVGGAS